MSDANYMMIYNIARALLQGNIVDQRKVVTLQEIQDAVNQARSLALIDDEKATKISRELESDFVVHIGQAAILEDQTSDHVPWLQIAHSDLTWDLSRRYMKWLESAKHMPPAVLGRLDEVTDQILSRLENPSRPGVWDRRGMVVGYVQSGKTSNYTSLICKAIDAGYKVVIVLAGMDDALRSQTQIRIDEGVLGFDTQGRQLKDQHNAKMGVGVIQQSINRTVHTLTSSDAKGDFKESIAGQIGVKPGGDPIILVVKKNVSILKNVIRWLTSFSARVEEREGHPVVCGIPILVIDDECDNASVNVKEAGEDIDPAAINKKVRELLRLFEQSIYIGYTATPFANVFIDPDPEGANKFGEDLFPRDFIISLKRSTDYVGPTRLFGVAEELEVGVEGSQELPIIRRISDFEEWLPGWHKKTWELGPSIPDSLETSILSFILVCAIRSARGQSDAHNSMLIHVTRFVDVQNDLKDLVDGYLHSIRHRIVYGDGERAPSIWESLKTLWESDFIPTSAQMVDSDVPTTSWEEIETHLIPAVKKIEVRSINGKSKEVLDYLNSPQGLSVIAVGGAKLSRGLTLEGLSVNYYLRGTRIYDTLMQMGRWFGYRRGYLDLCRLYTTTEICDSYREVALATEELLVQFDEMASSNGTPKDFGLRVRQSPTGLAITRAGAMRSATTMKVSYSGALAETVTFDCSAERSERNFQATQELVKTCDLHSEHKYRLEEEPESGLVYKDVPAEAILAFLKSYRTHPNSPRANNEFLSRYVEGRNNARSAELTRWVVVMYSVSSVEGGKPFDVAGHPIHPIKRAPLEGADLRDEARIKRLLSPGDETLGLSAEQVQVAMERTLAKFQNDLKDDPTKKKPNRPSPKFVREVRNPEEGLLLLYLINPSAHRAMVNMDLPISAMAMSFPESADALTSAIEYKVSTVYREQEFGND